MDDLVKTLSKNNLVAQLTQYATPNRIYWAILSFMFIEYLFEYYLTRRQYAVYKSAKDVPKELTSHIDKENFEKSRVYGKDKCKFSMVSDFYAIIVSALLLHYEGLFVGWNLSISLLDYVSIWPSTWDLEIGRSVSFVIVASLFNSIITFPLSLYSTFVIEERNGFNKQTFPFFMKDFFKKIVVSLALACPIVALIVKIVKAGGPYFFVWLWIFCFIVMLILMTIFPTFIAPLFDKYTPLRDGPLKTKIEALAAKIKFPLTKLYVVEGSKRSAHSNAYLYGFFNNKRIVLFDTLLKGYVKSEKEAENDKEDKEDKETTKEEKGEEKGCSDDEIESVLAHELGHWKLNHVTKNIVISQINLFFIFSFFAFFYQNSMVYEAFGFPRAGSKPIIIGLIVVLQFLLQIYNTAMGYLMNILSRRFEYQADNFAVLLGYGKFLKQALVKLNKDNLSFPVSDPWYSAWHHSHPTLLHRMRAIDVEQKKEK